MRAEIVVVRVGKRGVTDSVINEIRSVLKKHGMVKVRFLKSFRESTDNFDKREVAREIARMTNSAVEDLRGFTVVLRRT